ncbi:PepSY-associated TM helix domain-containing protein [Paucibacter sp. PLA-PC-4]|uniref:PepSY-associated TM helix domain-containing protein n=1 Tax=Paucibacter sp. PLA-PC-4 TaxID=2993655 RepID=UPI002249819E|nr:PepSY-associated TM helix domain-containing protein [Paucibacter sp. PLA-PC-4]MCX2860291.1 PepSY-associated TM helix domain-containing protein [Paucibacter sp. PLA-PC-4]
MMRPRAWFRLHSWLGVLSGLLLFVLCWSGTVATLAHEIDWLLTPQLRVQPQGHFLPLEALHRPVQAAYPQARIDRLQAPLGARFAAQVVIDLPAQRNVRVFVDPYTAEIRGSASYFSVQRFFRSFHITLFNGQWGLYLVWVMSVPMAVSLIAPLCFYKRWWQRFLVLKTDRGRRVFWSDAHKLVGLWCWAFGLVIAVTGLWFLFEALRGDVGDGISAWAGPGGAAMVELPRLPTQASLDIEALAAKARQGRPELDIKTLGLDRAGYFYVDGQAGQLLLRDRANKLYLDPSNGRVAYDQQAAKLSAYWRWSDTADPLHFGDFAGLGSKLLWFVFGLGLSGLCLSGAYLHAQRLRADAAAPDRVGWAGTGAATLATVLVLAASVSGGLTEIQRFGPKPGGVAQRPDIAWPVAAFLVAWVLITLAALGWWVWMLRRPSRTLRAAPGLTEIRP